MTSLSILVTVGSDHHPFGRLIGWVDDWLTVNSGAEVSCAVQHGTAPAPRRGTATDFLPHQELQRLLRQADVVVTQGGPMGIVEARRCGTKPIAVPRLSKRGEVVDDHQVEFCRRLAAAGDLVLAEDAPTLWGALDRARAEPGIYRLEPGEVDECVQQTVERFADLVAELPARRAVVPRFRFGRRRR